MSEQNGAQNIPEQLREGWKTAERRFNELEKEAEKRLKAFVEKSRSQRKELSELVQKLSDSKELRGRAESVRHDVEVRLQQVQRKFLKAAGLATQEQIHALSRQLDRLNKKVTRLGRGKKSKSQPAASAQ